ncbi:hypothetical protein Tco_0658791 [Tanacetum coccineum]
MQRTRRGLRVLCVVKDCFEEGVEEVENKLRWLSKFMASGEECLDGWVGAGGGEVKGGGVVFRVSRILLGEIPGDIMGESDGVFSVADSANFADSVAEKEPALKKQGNRRLQKKFLDCAYMICCSTVSPVLPILLQKKNRL